MEEKLSRRHICSLLLVVLLGVAVFGGRMYAMRPQESKAEQAERILRSMSQTEKLGQMMMIGIGAKTADENALYQLHQFHFGGIILFDRNMESLTQVRKLTSDLQKQAEEKLPLFIALDEEGGRVARMREALPAPPAQREIGLQGKPELAEQYALSTAKNLHKLGINVNFAPVADLGDLGREGTRHYSSDAAMVTEFVRAAASGYAKEKMYFALKHFPGIGKGKADTHLDRVVINAAKAELWAEDLLPFRQMAAQQQATDYFMMVSHSTYPQISGDKPASLSKEIMQDLLRNELGYQGVIITDDMEMGAVSKYHNWRELGVLAVEAGADIVLVCHDYAHETEVYLGLLEALQSGRLSEERVNDSVRRIIRMKLNYL